MDMKEEMMSDAVDDVMDDEAEGEGEEEEGDKVLREVLDEIGVSMGQMVCQMICLACTILTSILSLARLPIMHCPRHPRYPTDKLSQKAWVRTLDHQVGQRVNRLQDHLAAVAAEGSRMRMHYKRGWISYEGIEHSGFVEYSSITVVYYCVVFSDGRVDAELIDTVSNAVYQSAKQSHQHCSNS